MAWPLSWMPPVTIRSCPMPSCNTPYTGWVPYYTTFSICRNYLASNKGNMASVVNYGIREKRLWHASNYVLYQDLKLSRQTKALNSSLLEANEAIHDRRIRIALLSQHSQKRTTLNTESCTLYQNVVPE
jgi:hypothetical protein